MNALRTQALALQRVRIMAESNDSQKVRLARFGF
jgi:hypothetical protein